MAKVAAKYDVPLILMHNRLNGKYTDFMADVLADLRQSVDIAKSAGVKEERLILDPGIGFAKTYQQNLETMRQIDQIIALGFPVLLGTSRKSLIGITLGLPVEERLEGTLATIAIGIMKGVHIVRVHDVRAAKRVCQMTDAIVRGKG